MSDSQKTTNYSEISLESDDFQLLFEAAMLKGSVDEQGSVMGNRWFRTTYLVVYDKGEDK